MENVKGLPSVGKPLKLDSRALLDAINSAIDAAPLLDEEERLVLRCMRRRQRELLDAPSET